MSTQTDRDPISFGHLAGHVCIFLNACHPGSTTPQEEADMAFERVLLEQGVMSPADQIDYLVGYPLERRVLVVLNGSERISINTAGEVEAA